MGVEGMGLDLMVVVCAVVRESWWAWVGDGGVGVGCGSVLDLDGCMGWDTRGHR